MVLGIGLAIAPVGGYLAVAGSWSTPWWMLLALAAGVSLWTAGFDISHALQDEEFDRAEELHSIPRGIRLDGLRSPFCSAVARGDDRLSGCGWTRPCRWAPGLRYSASPVAAAAAPGYEHSLVRSGDDLSRLDAAFFTMNGVISLTGFFGFVLAERLVGMTGGPRSPDRRRDHRGVGSALRRSAPGGAGPPPGRSRFR